jgi:hypothetical protein
MRLSKVFKTHLQTKFRYLCGSCRKNLLNIAILPVKSPSHKTHGSHFVPVFGRPLSCALIHLKNAMKMKLSKSYTRTMQAAFAYSENFVVILRLPPRKICFWKTVTYPSKTVNVDVVRDSQNLVQGFGKQVHLVSAEEVCRRVQWGIIECVALTIPSHNI